MLQMGNPETFGTKETYGMQPHNCLRSSLGRKGQGPSGRRNLFPAMGLGVLVAPMASLWGSRKQWAMGLRGHIQSSQEREIWSCGEGRFAACTAVLTSALTINPPS